VVNLSSSDTKEALELLSLPLSNRCLSFDSDLFEDWLEANDMVASVYVVLTTDALSSHASIVYALHGS
jgi:hypothetical protein